MISQNFVPIQAPIGVGGTGLPLLQEAPSTIRVVAQPDDSQVLTAGPLLIPVVASSDNETDSILFRANGPMSNVRMTLTDTTSGVVLKYLPNKAAVQSGVGGMEFIAGDNTINMSSLEPNTAGMTNVGFTPVRLRAGALTVVTIYADNINLLGNSSNIPYLENVLHPLFLTTIARKFDTSNIADDYLRINSEYQSTSATPAGIVSNYLADAAEDTVTGGQFTAGVAGVNTD